MRLTRFLVALALLLPPSLAHAQSALPGLVGLPRGSSGCVFNSVPPVLSNSQPSFFQCDTSGNLKVNVQSAVGLAQGSTTSGQTGSLILGAVTTGNPSYTTAQTSPLSLDVNGGLRVAGEGVAGTATGGVLTVQGVASMTALTVAQATGSNLHVVCDSGCSSSTAPADESAFTFGTTSQTPVGGVFQTTATSNALTTGQMGAFQVTANRALFTNLRNAAGTEIGTAATPVQVSLANTAANGTAVLVTGTGGTFPAALNATPSLANGNGIVQTQGGAVLSATNGAFTNLLQGNAVLSTGNPIFAQLTTGAAVIGALVANQSVNLAQVNAVTVLTGAGAVGTGTQRIAVGQDTTTIAGSAPGTAGTASANVVSVQGIAAMTPLLTNPGTPANWAIAATAATVPANAKFMGCQGINAEITAVTNGQLVGCVADLVGKIITSPHANKENFLTGSTAAIATATNTSVIAAQAAGIKIYMTGFSCANTGATASLIQFTSGSGGSVIWTTINPAGSGTNGVIDPPVATAAATALFVTTASASTNQLCSVTGYKGT